MAHRWFVLALFVVGTWVSRVDSGATGDASMRAKFEDWMAKFGRVYTDDLEKEQRFEIFKDNYNYVESANSNGNLSYTLAMNQFGDMTNDEFDEYVTCAPADDVESPKSTTGSFRYENASVPDYVNWISKNAVLPVENQGTCGCCWAFSAKAAIEAINSIKTGVLVSLSAQQLLDCVSSEDGCKGGKVIKAYRYVNANGGITSTSNDPYAAEKRACGNIIYRPAATIRGFENVPGSNELALMQAVAQQPVAISICSRKSPAFKYYSGGIFQGPCGTCASHGMTIVGYGDDGLLNPQPGGPSKYWLVKNSWGNKWGLKGFMYIQRQAGPPEGMCGLALNPSYPTK